MKDRQKVMWLVVFSFVTITTMCKADENHSASYEQIDSGYSTEDGVKNSDVTMDYLIESELALKKRLAIEQFEREEAAKRERRRKLWLAKEKKFKQFFSAKNECDKVIWWSKRVECTNEKIKARKKFEKLYQAGSFTQDTKDK